MKMEETKREPNSARTAAGLCRRFFSASQFGFVPSNRRSPEAGPSNLQCLKSRDNRVPNSQIAVSGSRAFRESSRLKPLRHIKPNEPKSTRRPASKTKIPNEPKIPKTVLGSNPTRLAPPVTSTQPHQTNPITNHGKRKCETNPIAQTSPALWLTKRTERTQSSHPPAREPTHFERRA